MAVEIRAHITGNVWKILVKPGDAVKAGDAVVILESMKMEIPIEVEAGGVVSAIPIALGQAVTEGDVVLILG
ncbi:MAG: biotin/lipoyl-binding carrier protein [Deltaproteobacteria bacterium]|nr:biotin/lipoyl-binding carrier protein [Deltaproteobacteria bacterium]